MYIIDHNYDAQIKSEKQKNCKLKLQKNGNTKVH